MNKDTEKYITVPKVLVQIMVILLILFMFAIMCFLANIVSLKQENNRLREQKITYDNADYLCDDELYQMNEYYGIEFHE